MAVLLVPFFVPIPVELRRHPVIGILGDRLHIVLLGAICLLIYWRGVLRGRLWPAALAAAGIGAAIEFVQILVGRAALFWDFQQDLIGIGLVVGFVLWRGHRSIWGLLMMVALLTVIPAQLHYLPGLIEAEYRTRQSFPLLADFETDSDRRLWKETYDGVLVFTAHADTRDSAAPESGFLRLVGVPPSRWPGARMRYFPYDWTGYSRLLIDVRHRTPGRQEMDFSVRLDDFAGRKDKVWVSDDFVATSQWQTISIPLVNRRVRQDSRILDIADMDAILIFLRSPQDTMTIEIDNLRLQ